MSWELHEMDCRLAIPMLIEPKSIHCCVTSPPYFGLRDYGHADQIGLEPTPDEFVAAMVEVFRLVRDALRDDGTLWLNLGDSYSRGFGGGSPGKKSATNVGSVLGRKTGKVPNGMSPKDLIGIPWRVAFALQADGWCLRQDIIWHKPNPMPESVRDRCTKAHEYIFMFSKSPKYYFDSDAVREPAVSDRERGRPNGAATFEKFGRNTSAGVAEDGKRNRRSVWTVATQPFKEAHFATYPPALIEPCILAGCPTGGTVLDPFGGAGTTALVAERTGRNSVSCELNPEYAAIMRRRLG